MVNLNLGAEGDAGGGITRLKEQKVPFKNHVQEFLDVGLLQWQVQPGG